MTQKPLDRTVLDDLVTGKLSPDESLRVLDLIDREPDLSRELDIRVALMDALASGQTDDAWQKQTRQSGVAGRIKSVREVIASYVAVRQLAIPVAISGALLLAGIGVMRSLPLQSAERFALFKVESPEVEINVRGAGEDDIKSAHMLFRTGKYREAIALLERYTKAFPQSPTTAYAEYSLGAMFLASADRRVLGVLQWFDKSTVEAGLEHLAASLDSSSSPRIIEESHWLRAKGLLMLNDLVGARRELEVVAAQHGVRETDVRRLEGAIVEGE
jgi:hypothetical protein